MITALFIRELKLAYHEGDRVGTGLIFFLSLLLLFTLATGPEAYQPDLQRPEAPGFDAKDPDTGGFDTKSLAILWIGPLIAILLGISRLFQSDAADGTLDIYLLAPISQEVLMLTKSGAFWLTAALPFVLLSPIFGLMLGVSVDDVSGTFICLLIGTIGMVFIGSFAAALTAQIARNGLLVMIIALPFLAPCLIFGVSASRNFIDDPAMFTAPFCLLIAFTLFSGLVSTLIGAACLRPPATIRRGHK